MTEQSLPHGTRVRTCITTALVPPGTEGFVLGVWPTIPQAYDVRFDGLRAPLLMWEDELERVEAMAVGAP